MVLPSGIVKLDGLTYTVARNRAGELQYSHVSGPIQLGLGLWEKVVFEDGMEGLGYAYDMPGAPEHGYLYSHGAWTVLPHAITPDGQFTRLATNNTTDHVRYFFEDTDGVSEFLYCIKKNSIQKFNSTSLVSVDVFDAADAGFDANDRFGRPEKVTVGAGAQKWVIPCNNGTRLLELTTVAAGADTWTVRNITDGASHLIIAGPNVWRSVAQLSAGVPIVPVVGPKIRACAVENDITVIGNWGDSFPAGQQSAKVSALVALLRYVVVVTDRNAWGATEDFDASVSGGAVSFSEMLPDLFFQKEEENGLPIPGFSSTVWDGNIMVPLNSGLVSHGIDSYTLVGTDSFFHIYDPAVTSPALPRFGKQRGFAAAGEWGYSIYEISGQWYAMACRRRKPWEEGRERLVWHILLGTTDALRPAYIQKNGPDSPTFWFASPTELWRLPLGGTGDPYKPGARYGLVPDTGTWWGKEFSFSNLTKKICREVETRVVNGDANLRWLIKSRLDSAAAVDVGVFFTASGSNTVFFPAGTDARKIRIGVRWAAVAGYSGTGNTVRVTDIVARGSYIPDVADNITVGVDILATAQRRGVSSKKVRDELSALTLSDSYPYVDIHGSALQVTVEQHQFSEGGAQKPEGVRETAELRLLVQESS